MSDPPPTEPAEPGAAGPVDPTWDPEGTDLARAAFAQARATARSGRPGPTGSAPARRPSGRWWQRRPVGESTWSGPGPDDRDPQSLSWAVERLVGEHGWAEDLAVHGVIARWDLVVGPEVAGHVQPEHYADGILAVRADTTAWATQVRLLAPTLMRRLNEEIGDGTVRRVEVRGPHAPSWRKGPRVVRGRGPRDTYG